MRNLEAIDAELQLLSRAWRVARVLCDRMPSTEQIDRLLDERAAAAAAPVLRQDVSARCRGTARAVPPR
jgi:hypothetical protein